MSKQKVEPDIEISGEITKKEFNWIKENLNRPKFSYVCCICKNEQQANLLMKFLESQFKTFLGSGKFGSDFKFFNFSNNQNNYLTFSSDLSCLKSVHYDSVVNYKPKNSYEFADFIKYALRLKEEAKNA